jgi:hypothetical protein
VKNLQRWCLSLLTLVSVEAACSGSDAGAPSDPRGGLDDPDAGAVDDAGTKSDAAESSAPLPDAGLVPPGDAIDPIQLGYAWTYDVTILGSYPLCTAGKSTGKVIGPKTVAGKSAFQVQSFCPGAGSSNYAVDGDKVEIEYLGAWVLALDAPVEAGHTWSNGVTTYRWEDAGSVTVPAGTFTRCWTAKESGGSSNATTFCRGVGPVRWHYTDALGNGYDAVLTAKNF